MKTLAAIVLIVVALIYFSFGTLSPCGMLRATIRKHDNLAAVLPDSVVDFALAAQYGDLSPGRCVAILLGGESKPTTASAPAAPRPVGQPPVQPQTDAALQNALRITNEIANECRAKRIRGELPSYVASVDCSNPRMIQAFNDAHYRYMDLIQWWASKRRELAEKLDRHEVTEAQAQADTAKIYSAIVNAERQRDKATTH
jgi:hypothetical protein